MNAGMRVAVIGTGGIGGYFGGRLALAGHDVTFVARGEHLAAIGRHGLRVDSVVEDFVVPNPSATDDPTAVAPVDLVLLAVKTWQLADVLPALPSLVEGDAAVLTLQNGVETPARVAAVVGERAVLPGTAKIFAGISSPGVVTHVGGPASVSCGEWDNRRTDRLAGLVEAFRDAGVPTTVADDVWVELWSKLLFVEPLGALGTALDAPVGVLRTVHRELLGDAMAEVAALAAARDVRLPEGLVAGSLAFLDDQPEGATSSLQRDVLAGRPSELDAWTGAVVRLAGEVDLTVPVHRTLLAVITARHPGALG